MQQPPPQFQSVASLSEVRAVALAATKTPLADAVFVKEQADGSHTRVTLWSWGAPPRRFDVWVDVRGLVVTTRDTTPTETWGNAHTRFQGVRPVTITPLGGDAQLKGSGYIVWDGLQGYPAPGNAPVAQTDGTGEIGNGAGWEEAGLYYYWDADWWRGNYPDEFRTPNALTPAGELAYGMETAQAFYRQVLGRNGYNGQGTLIHGIVHAGYRWDNAAYADGFCECLYFGDGSLVDGKVTASYGLGFKNLTTLEIVGHELTHGFTSSTSALDYWGQSGGLNEATSDIFGKAIYWWDRAGRPAFVPTPTADEDWQIGAGLYVAANGVGPLRYMKRPSADRYSQDYADVPVPSDLEDVHYLSGPLNRWFYFASIGVKPETDPDTDGQSQRLAEGWPWPLGTDKAFHVWAKSAPALPHWANYADAAWTAIRVAQQQYGAGSLEEHATRATFAAIGAFPRNQMEAVVTRINKTDAAPGDLVEIRGGGFYPNSLVLVGGVVAEITNMNEQWIEFKAPDCDGGKVAVENGRGLSWAAYNLNIHRAPAITSLTATPTAFLSGANVTVSWATERSESTTLNGQPVPPSGTVVFQPVASTTYRLAATSKSGITVDRTVVVELKNPDLNGDGVVDPYDVIEIAKNWGKPGKTDLNGDGTTDALDIIILKENIK